MSANYKQTRAKEHKSSTCDGADAMDLATIAYVDESVRMAADPPSYLMAATVPMRDGQLAPFEALVRRWCQGNDTILLVADSHASYDDVVVSASNPSEVAGTVVWAQSRDLLA